MNSKLLQQLIMWSCWAQITTAKRNFNNNFQGKYVGCFKFIHMLKACIFFHTHKVKKTHLTFCVSVNGFCRNWLRITNLDRLEYNSWMDHRGILLGNCILVHGFERYNRHWHRKFLHMDLHNYHFCNWGDWRIRNDRDIRFGGNELTDYRCIRLDRSKLDGPKLRGNSHLIHKDCQCNLDLYSRFIDYISIH